MEKVSVVTEGEAHRATLEAGLVRCVIRRARSASSDAIADEMERLADRLKTLGPSATALILDVREAPGVAGPRSQAALTAIFIAYSRMKKRIAVVVGDDALKQLQLRRLLAESASRHSATFNDVTAAERWLAEDTHARE
jgi:hypothetical protein